MIVIKQNTKTLDYITITIRDSIEKKKRNCIANDSHESWNHVLF